MKGYKVFNSDFTSKSGGMQYAENQTFEVELPISICNSGLHFCTKASDCFSYYTFDPTNIVCEVEALGETKTHSEDSKVCTNILKVGRKLTWAEVLSVANEGIDNTGHSNSGDRNSGDSNSGYRNSGAFCLDNNPKIYLFDKPTNINVRDWEQSRSIQIMSNLLNPNIWIYSENMTKEEKEQNPKHETTGGYLKHITMQEAWKNMWGNLKDDEKKEFTSLPNFDADKFEKITGIKT